MRRLRHPSTGSGLGPSTRSGLRDESGYSLLEMLVSVAIVVSVTGGIFSVVNPTQGLFQTQPEMTDVQQRMRVGTDLIYKELLMAGAGTYSGSMVGTLGNYLASVVPRRMGSMLPDAPNAVFDDRISFMYVPPTPSQTTIRDTMPPGSNVLKVNAQPGCPASQPLCGFTVGQTVMIFDDTGTYDTFKITSISDPSLQIRHQGVDLSKTYASNSYVAQVVTSTIYWNATTDQLMRYDGDQTDLPVADNVVGLRFEYFGEPLGPVLKKAVSDPKGPWTTYGPKPPALGVDNTADNWGAGENCVFMVAGGQHTPRLPNLGAANANLVPLTAAMMTDGPWCPDSASPSRYDADLLRIRKIRISYRVQVADASLRGPAGAMFTRGGTSTAATRMVPDQEIRFEVTPRNLNFGR